MMICFNMAKLESLAQYDYARSYTEYLTVICLEETEEETRHHIREAVTQRLKEAKTGFERGMITIAKARLDALSYDEIIACFQVSGEKEFKEHKTYDIDTPLRLRALSSLIGDEIVLEEDDRNNRYEVRLIFRYKDEMYTLLKDVEEIKDTIVPHYYFYEFLFAEELGFEDDVFHRVHDEDLISELCDEAKRLMDLIDKRALADTAS